MSFNRPLVSVVMSVYNEDSYLENAVTSILNQSFQDLELIIVDDGSVDKSLYHIEQFQDNRIRIVRQKHQGLAIALNKGIYEARGEYIARQDADDISERKRLEKQIQLLEKHPEVGLVGCNATIIDEYNNKIASTNYPTDNATLQRWLFDGFQGNPFIHGAVIFRKSVSIEVGLYRPEFSQAQDVDLWLRIAEISQLAIIQNVAYRWRIRKKAIGVTNRDNQRDFAMLARHCASCRRKGRPEPELYLPRFQRNFIRNSLSRSRSSDEHTEYYFKIARVLLNAGHKSSARIYLSKVIHRCPFNLYAWLLLCLSTFPKNLTNYLWNQIGMLYRKAIWRG